MTLSVTITTYDRAAAALALVRDLMDEIHALRPRQWHVHVFDDGTPKDRALCGCDLPQGVKLFRSEGRHAKPMYWHLYDQALHALEGVNANYYLFLPDDVRLTQGSLARLIETWQAIRDPLKICLNPMTVRGGTRMWNGFQPRGQVFRREGQVFNVWRSDWMDCAFFSERTMLQVLGHTVYPVPGDRWDTLHADGNPLSSGVGRQITKRLTGRGWRLYQMMEPVVQEAGLPTRMQEVTE